PILSRMRRTLHKLWQTLGRGNSPTTAAYLEAFRRYRPGAVLAEYGPMGVAVSPACKHADTPLIVHFHGFDASVHTVLQENAQKYPDMFQQASAVIAVSRAMERKLVSLGAAPEKVRYNAYGVDCQQFWGGSPASMGPKFLAVG